MLGPDDDPPETWAPPNRPPISDAYGHPLTWGSIVDSHRLLVWHASCTQGGYASDGDDDNDGAAPCPCQWHDVLIDELANSRADIAAWPGFICGPCYAASCECGYVFEDAAHAAGRDNRQRLVCHEPACLARVIGPV